MFSWLDNKDKDFKNIFINAVKFQDDELYDSSLESIFDAISMKPSTQNIDKLSQYFTPVDVALYTAYNLLKDKKHGCGQMITHPYLIINKLKAIRFS